MQTFLPYKNFARSAACLDRHRLGKQRLECLDILRILLGTADDWLIRRYGNHAAVRMWRGYEWALACYGSVICTEWTDRGYRDTRLPLIMQEVCGLDANGPPPWLGNRTFHRSHKSNLLRKNPGHYKQFGWNVPDDLPYYWPVSKGE